MSEEAVQEVSEEVTSDVVDAGVEETSVSDDVQVEDSSPELDLTDVFSESTPDQTDDFRSRVEQAGVRFEDDTQPREALFNAYTQAQEYNQQWQQYHQQQEAQRQQQAQQQQQMQQMAQYGMQQYQQQQQMQMQEYQRQLEQQQYEQEMEYEQEGVWWNPPDLDKEEIAKYRTRYRGHDGQMRWDWKVGTPQEIKDAAEDYVEYHKGWNEALRERPDEVLPEIIEKEFDKLFIDRYGRLMDEYREEQHVRTQEQAVNDINVRNADWLYQNDPRTGQAVMDHSGEPVLSPQGERVIGYINGLRESGMTDPQQLWDTASRLLAGELAQGALHQTRQQMQSAQQVQQRNMRHLQNGASHIPNRGGSMAPPENPSPTSQNQSLSPGDKLRQQALADGLF